MTYYFVTQFEKTHRKNTFNCRNEALNRYIQKQASQDIKRNLSAVYVLLDDSNTNMILGYYTLSASSILLDNMPQELSKKTGRYPLIPVTLLGRLALDIPVQCLGIGEMLLVDALKRMEKISHQLGSMAVVVDAIDNKATAFYKRFGFTSFGDKLNQLFLSMTTIKKL